ncbi:MAG: sulfite exporter TauE/SafE family protein [Pseudomonadota bacterium]
MIELSLAFFALAVPAVVFAGVSKAGFGSGASFAAAPILALILDPLTALGLLLPLYIVIDLATLRPYWGRWSLRNAALLMLGSLPGVALGASLLLTASDDVFRVLIGALALAFVGWSLLKARGVIPLRRRPFPRIVGILTGLTAGFTSTISHAGGPPVAVYLLAQGLSKTTYQATTVLVFWAVNLAKAVPYAALGVFTAETLWAGVLLAPVALFGAWLGVRIHHHLPEPLFFRITYFLLSVTGAKLVWDGLSGG